VILTTLCGHGHFDMSSYAKYLEGGLKVCQLDMRTPFARSPLGVFTH
jgi:hypothetical protein